MQPQTIQSRIYDIRGQKVMLDHDLAELYHTETKKLKQAVRRNSDRFPEDFMFELTRDEYNSLRSQIVTLKSASARGKFSKYLPFAFTEQGVAMLSSVLRSKKAIQVNIAIMPACRQAGALLCSSGNMHSLIGISLKDSKNWRRNMTDNSKMSMTQSIISCKKMR